MPVITFETDKLTKEQKQELVNEFTETAARVMNIPKEAFYVFLKENKLENIGVGGILLSEGYKKMNRMKKRYELK